MAHALSIIDHMLDGIENTDPSDLSWSPDIRPRLHRIVLTGPYRYDDLKKEYGRLYVDATYDPVTGPYPYRTRLIRNSADFTMIMYVNRSAPRPDCLIEIHPRGDVSMEVYKEFLIEIHEHFPLLSVSTAEYATDLYCRNSNGVQNLFWIMRRHLYAPYQRTTRLYGESFERIGKNNALNFVFRLGEDDKLYERGDDRDKGDVGWALNKVNRVRWERRPRFRISKHRIRPLKAFIENPKFYNINKGALRFCHFERSAQLPELGSDYDSLDENGNAGSFQNEMIFYRPKVCNINQYRVDTEQFKPLLCKLHEVWQDFDRQWKEI